MVNLFKVLVVAVLIFMAIRFVSSHRKVSSDPATAHAANIASGADANGFRPFPAPFTIANGPVLILEGTNGGPEGEARAQALTDGLNSDRILNDRTNYLPTENSRNVTDEETARLHAIIGGAQPLVVVNGKYCNNPSLAQIEDEYGYVRR